MVGIDEILIYIIIPLIFLIIIYFIWKKYGEDEKVNSITSKYPPITGILFIYWWY